MTIKPYNVFAKEAYKHNKKVTQLEVEKSYANYLKTESHNVEQRAQAVKAQMTKSTPAPPPSKSATVVTKSRLANAGLTAAVALRDHITNRVRRCAASLRPTLSTPIVAHCATRFPVITYSASGFTTITVPTGSRFWFAPAAGGESAGAFFVAPTNDSVWLASTLRPDLPNAQYSSVLGGAGGINTGGFSSFGRIDQFNGNLESGLYNGVDPEPNIGQRRARTTMTSGSIDVNITTAYTGTALCSAKTTHSTMLHKSTSKIDSTAEDDDGVTGIRLLQTLSYALTPYGNTLAVEPVVVASSSQKSLSLNYTLAEPHWWRVGSAETDPAVASLVNINSCQIPVTNPFFNALHTGCFVSVEAIGGPVIITVKVRRTNHLEFQYDIGGYGNGETLLMQSLQRHAHYTTNHEEAQLQASAPIAKLAWAPNELTAQRQLDRALGLPNGTNSKALAISAIPVHPAPPATAASEAWGDVKAGAHFAAEAGKDIVSGVKTGLDIAKGLVGAFNDVKAFFAPVEVV